MKKRRLLLISIVFAIALFAGNAFAATSVKWLSPPDGSSYAVGSSVSLLGQAACSGTVGGSGLDLVLVLDSSGSMSGSRSAAMKVAANALVDALPTNTTSVAVVEFDSDANTVQTLLGLTSVTNINTIKAAINSVDASGGTDIGDGITEATTVLTGTDHTAGRSQMMVVVSDGGSSAYYANLAADNAMAAGVDAIHTVGIPGHNTTVMAGIPGGTDHDYSTTADNYGVYTDASDLSTLTGIFDGTGGSLVGIDYVTVTLPDGTILNSNNGDFSVDGLGNFTIGGQVIAAGAQDYVATAYCDQGLPASDTLTLNGVGGPDPIPEPGTILLFGVGLLGLSGASRKKNNNK